MSSEKTGLKSFTFEELSLIFRDQVKAPELYNCGEFNLIKIVQHAIGAHMQNAKMPVRISFNKSEIYHRVISKIQIKRRQALYDSGEKVFRNIEEKSYLVFSGGNCLLDENGIMCSSNTRNILEELGRENCLYIYKEYKGKFEETGQDFNFSEIQYYAENQKLDEKEKLLLSNISETYRRVKQSAEMSDERLSYFEIQLQIFFNNFRAWYLILQKCNPSKIYFTVHYHHEGIIAAAKTLGIEIIELQHGLISKNDYYYIYNKQFSSVIDKAIFADKILLFGEYWGRVLDHGCEYPKSKRAIIGSFQYRPKITIESIEAFKLKHTIGDRKVILVATQKNIAEFYTSYIHSLAAKMQDAHPEYLILVKPHPSENHMSMLETCLEHSNVRLCERTDNLMLALQISDIQISLYSTTFFDAIGSGVVNLCLFEHEAFRTYAELIIEDGIALRLKFDEDPVTVVEEHKNEIEGIQRGDYYAEFNRQFYTL